MSRVISLRDLKRIPSLRTYEEDAMIRPGMDEIMFLYLEALGFDLNSPIDYIPSVHRDMSGYVAIGYQAVGEVVSVKSSHPYLRHPICPLIERLMAVAKKDPSLAFELSSMSGTTIKLEASAVEDEINFPEELIEPGYNKVAAQIAALTERRNNVRKVRYNENGSVKTPKEILQEIGRK